MPRRKATTERLDFPPGMLDFAKRRTDDLIRACVYESNIIESIALSCYVQGCMDAIQLVEQRPAFLDELREAQAQAPSEDPGYGHGV